MKTLLLLRHAKSSWNHPELSDHDRPLNKRGKRDAPRMGELLRDESLVPDIALVSTAVRARCTFEMVAEAAGFHGELQLLSDLYLAAPDTYLRLLAGASEAHQSAIMVGHNPGIEHLVGELTGTPTVMPTAALARIQLDIATWPEATGPVRAELLEVWRPKEL